MRKQTSNSKAKQKLEGKRGRLRREARRESGSSKEGSKRKGKLEGNPFE
jgi:hypothetical protein